MITRISLCAAVVVALSGCANVSTDPHAGGLMGGIHGITTGAYDKRLVEKQAEVDDLQAAGDALGRRVGDAQARLKSLDRTLAERSSKLSKMKADIAAIDRVLASGAIDTSINRGALERVRADNARKEELLRPLQAERDMLARMVEELEQDHIVEAQNYKRLRSLGGPGQDGSSPLNETQMADLEKRLQESAKKEQGIERRLDQAKRDAGLTADTG